MRIALFITCFNDTLFPNVGIASTQLLERLGHFVEVFGTAEAIVAPSASCVGMVRDLYPKAAALSGDKQLVEDVKLLVPRVYELSELLVKRLGVTDVGAYYPHRVTYHPITLISGPSATSDIELSRVEGVHGPRTLHVFVVNDW